MDNLTKQQRHKCMSHIQSTDSKPEDIFRKFLWSQGIRGYRKNDKKILGKPDVYFPKKKLAVFIDGCFWHKCPRCYKEPKSNKAYWIHKLQKNIERDEITNQNLLLFGIKYIRIWEHEVKKNLLESYKHFKEVYDECSKNN